MKNEPKQFPVLPWPLVLAVLTAFIALRFTSERTSLLFILGSLLVIQRIGGFVLPQQLAGSRSLRLGIYSLVAMIVGLPNSGLSQWYLNPDYTNLAGHLLAAEIVIRAWSPLSRQPRLILVLSTLLLAAASNTLERANIQLFTPVYFTLAILSLRSELPPRPSKVRFRAMRIVVSALATVLGFVMIDVLTRLERDLQLWAMQFVRRSARSSDIGLSTMPQLGSSFNLQPSMQRVMIIEGPRSERHWRVLAFETLESNQWSPSLRTREFRYIPTEPPAQPRAGDRLDVQIIGDTFDVLPLPLNTSVIETPAELDREPTGAFRYRLARGAEPYTVTVDPDEHYQGMASLAPNDVQLARNLVFPASVDLKVKELAIRVAGEGDARTKTIRIAQHLRAGHEYSLNFTAGGGDPLSDFILNARAAHCEFFASAMVVMCRAAGVPARLVTGYYAHEPSGEDRMIVRDRDAHAWAECWIEGAGWVTMDATPPSGLPDALFEPPSRLRQIWESIVDFPSLVQKWLSFLSRETVLWIVFLSAGAAIVVGIVQLRRKKPATGPPPYALPDGRLVVLGERFEKWQRSHGPACPQNRTWREQSRIAEERTFIDLYDEARFGAANGERFVEMERLLVELESRKV